VLPGAAFLVIGISYLVRYRNAEVRKTHIEEWTGKA
jgi:hypothetical protein